MSGNHETEWLSNLPGVTQLEREGSKPCRSMGPSGRQDLRGAVSGSEVCRFWSQTDEDSDPTWTS